MPMGGADGETGGAGVSTKLRVGLSTSLAGIDCGLIGASVSGVPIGADDCGRPNLNAGSVGNVLRFVVGGSTLPDSDDAVGAWSSHRSPPVTTTKRPPKKMIGRVRLAFIAAPIHDPHDDYEAILFVYWLAPAGSVPCAKRYPAGMLVGSGPATVALMGSFTSNAGHGRSPNHAGFVLR